MDDAVETLRTAAYNFIVRTIEVELGAAYVADYSPPRNAGAETLLHYVENKWLGIFQDVMSEADRDALAACRALLKDRRTRKFVPPDALSAAVQRALKALRAPGCAAAVAKQAAAARVRVEDVGDGDAAMGDAPPPPPQQPHAPAQGSTDDHAMLDVDFSMQPGAGGSGLVPVVLDGANIGWAHGGGRRFSICGAAAALAYFQRLGHPCTLVLPESLLSGGQAEQERSAAAWLQTLRHTTQLMATPDCDYDDAYVTHLGRRHAAVVVSNDRFRDAVHQAAADGPAAATAWNDYLRRCRCSYAFHGNAFVPNPAFDFRRAATVARRYAANPD